MPVWDSINAIWIWFSFRLLQAAPHKAIQITIQCRNLLLIWKDSLLRGQKCRFCQTRIITADLINTPSTDCIIIIWRQLHACLVVPLTKKPIIPQSFIFNLVRCNKGSTFLPERLNRLCCKVVQICPFLLSIVYTYGMFPKPFKGKFIKT